ncbi:MAG: hypothetical protein QME85_03490 [Candidatus Saccharicenans sp.]|nr:hypothetical protein [Candidatus Saccharicenans sp.]
MSTKKLIEDLIRRYERDEKLPELRVEQVINIISKEFEEYDYKAGSHIVIIDSRIKRYYELYKDNDFAPDGTFTIPVKSGQFISRFYIKDLVKALKLIRELEDKSE